MARRASLQTERKWRERLRRQHGSGLCVRRFCEQEGVSTAAYYHWKRRLAMGAAQPRGQDRLKHGVVQEPAGGSHFVPVTVTHRPVVQSTMAIEIELPNRAVVRLPATVASPLLEGAIRAAGGFEEGRPC